MIYSTIPGLALTLGSSVSFISTVVAAAFGAGYLRANHKYRTVALAQHRWRATIDSIDDFIFAHDDSGQVLQVNFAIADRLQSHPASLVGRRVDELLPRAEPGQGCPYCRHFSAGRLEGQDPCFGGQAVVSTARLASGVKGRTGVVHVVRDVTAQVAAEEHYRRLFYGLREAVFVTTPDGTILECNQALVRMLGYDSREDLMKVNASELYVHTSVTQRAAVQRAMEITGYVHNHELTLRKKDGTPVTALETSFATRDRNGNIVSYQGFLLDITQSKQAQEEIRRKNRELHALNTMADLTNRSLDLNEVLHAALGHVMELFGADTGSAYVRDRERKVLQCRASIGHSEQTQRLIAEVALTPEFLRHVYASRVEILEMDDAALPAHVRELMQREGLSTGLGVVLWSRNEVSGWMGVSWRAARVLPPGDRELMAALARQISTSVENARLYQQACMALQNLQHAQEQLLQSEKMSAVGQLVSGVAHELNNPLTAILGYSQLLEAEPMNERGRDFLYKIFRQAQRTHRIVQNLLSFSRQRQPHKEKVDVRKVLEETLLLREYDLRVNNIQVEREFDSHLPVVIADSHQLEQVFLNIINNAVDAILETGKSGVLRVNCFAQEGSVVAEFQDSGRGLRDSKRIFDPFYTTKEIGKGTGLGLSICYGIVKEHGGQITACNHPSGGAVFQVRLPVAQVSEEQAPRTAAGWQRQARADASLANCRILIVDDEEPVLEFEREALAGVGAEVTACQSGSDAVHFLRHHAFDVLVFDGKMPGAYAGIELCHWLREHRTDLLRRVILTDSDAANDELARAIRDYGVRPLSKPFQVGELLAACRAVVETNAPVLAPA
ncbi:MAG: PAS domain S-box protein [Acidobacteria bacterium]|nr:PAS domain S-box protein [Acidobacteriota bacterium]